MEFIPYFLQKKIAAAKKWNCSSKLKNYTCRKKCSCTKSIVATIWGIAVVENIYSCNKLSNIPGKYCGGLWGNWTFLILGVGGVSPDLCLVLINGRSTVPYQRNVNTQTFRSQCRAPASAKIYLYINHFLILRNQLFIF